MSEPKVFVVEDDLAMRNSLCWLISSVNLDTRAFASAKEFLEVLEPHQTGCVIIDVRMPEMSGLELQEALAASSSNLASIMISGHADVQMAVRAMKKGALEFIEKPFNDQELIELVQHAVEHSIEAAEELKFLSEVKQRIESLSLREHQVLRGMMAGHQTKIIAANLDLSPKTVEVHRANISRKMKAKSLVEVSIMVTKLEQIKGNA